MLQCCPGRGWLGTGQVRGKSQGSSGSYNFNVKFARRCPRSNVLRPFDTVPQSWPQAFTLYSVQIMCHPKTDRCRTGPFLLSKTGLYHTAGQDTSHFCLVLRQPAAGYPEAGTEHNVPVITHLRNPSHNSWCKCQMSLRSNLGSKLGFAKSLVS